VIKVFQLNLPPHEQHRLAASFERLIGRSLLGPGIVAPIASGTNGVTTYLVRGFVAADSLDVVLRRAGPTPVEDALRVSTQLARALEVGAVAGVHHGALHPRDVLVAPDQVWVSDLGVCQALEEVGVARPVRRPYAAPERTETAPWDSHADTYSLAALTYEMLTGRRVLAAGPAAVGAFPAVRGADMVALRATLRRGLARNPRARFHSAVDFVHALSDACQAGAGTAVKRA
jgi:serine/threonine protein kinase